MIAKANSAVASLLWKLKPMVGGVTIQLTFCITCHGYDQRTEQIFEWLTDRRSKYLYNTGETLLWENVLKKKEQTIEIYIYMI